MTSFDDNNKPRLRKVKKPKNRPAPETQMPSKSVARVNDVRERQEVVDSFDINNALDSNNPRYVSDADIVMKQENKFKIGDLYTINLVVLVSFITFFVGFGIAKFFFVSSEVVSDGLQGVVMNPEVPRGRARCGLAERTQGCVMYIVNPQREELSARDFYDLAAQLTGRQRYMIETNNLRYSTFKIKPGAIVQLNIPPIVN